MVQGSKKGTLNVLRDWGSTFASFSFLKFFSCTSDITNMLRAQDIYCSVFPIGYDHCIKKNIWCFYLCFISDFFPTCEWMCQRKSQNKNSSDNSSSAYHNHLILKEGKLSIRVTVFLGKKKKLPLPFISKSCYFLPSNEGIVMESILQGRINKAPTLCPEY